MKYVPLYVGFFGVGHTRQVTAAKNSVRRDLSLQLTSGPAQRRTVCLRLRTNTRRCRCVYASTQALRTYVSAHRQWRENDPGAKGCLCLEAIDTLWCLNFKTKQFWRPFSATVQDFLRTEARKIEAHLASSTWKGPFANNHSAGECKPLRNTWRILPLRSPEGEG